MKKFSEFPQATSLTGSDLLLISQFDGVSAYETKYVRASLAESVDKKEFIAMIEQTGVSAPTITVIKDDFVDTYSAIYVGVGSYEISGFNGELTGDEEISVNVNNLPLSVFMRTGNVSTTNIYINTSDVSTTLIDGAIPNATYIHVTKYL